MKKTLLTIVTLFVVINSSFATDKLADGLYKSEKCNHTFIISGSSFKLLKEGIKIEENIFQYDDNEYVTFRGISRYSYAEENLTPESKGISALINSKTSFSIQNYGNAMNPFVVFGECDEKYLDFIEQPSEKGVLSYKTFLYVIPNQPTKMYLIKGDKVTLLDEQMDEKGQKWYFINYKGEKDLNMWIKAEAIDINKQISE